MQADRRRFEYEPVRVLEHRYAAQGMARAVLLALALLARHRRDLIRLAELLERPCDADRPARVLSVIQAHHARHHSGKCESPARWAQGSSHRRAWCARGGSG